jgi:hypothetical protein
LVCDGTNESLTALHFVRDPLWRRTESISSGFLHKMQKAVLTSANPEERKERHFGPGASARAERIAEMPELKVKALKLRK